MTRYLLIALTLLAVSGCGPALERPGETQVAPHVWVRNTELDAPVTCKNDGGASFTFRNRNIQSAGKFLIGDGSIVVLDDEGFRRTISLSSEVWSCRG